MDYLTKIITESLSWDYLQDSLHASCKISTCILDINIINATLHASLLIKHDDVSHQTTQTPHQRCVAFGQAQRQIQQYRLTNQQTSVPSRKSWPHGHTRPFGHRLVARVFWRSHQIRTIPARLRLSLYRRFAIGH